jgi:P4 family phage/plasmid primase-like protien
MSLSYGTLIPYPPTRIPSNRDHLLVHPPSTRTNETYIIPKPPVIFETPPNRATLEQGCLGSDVQSVQVGDPISNGIPEYQAIGSMTQGGSMRCGALGSDNPVVQGRLSVSAAHISRVPPEIILHRNPTNTQERRIPAMVLDLQCRLPPLFHYDEALNLDPLDMLLYQNDYEHAIFMARDPYWAGNIYSNDNEGTKIYFFENKHMNLLWTLTNRKGLIPLIGQYFSQVVETINTAARKFPDDERHRLLKHIHDRTKSLTTSGKAKSIMDMLLPITHTYYNNNKLDKEFNNNTCQFPITPLMVFDYSVRNFIYLRKDHYWTYSMDIPIEDNTDDREFHEFVLEIMSGNLDMTLFLQRWFGYCLTGLTKERKMLIFWGVGNNGKSTLLSLIQRILGRYYLEAKKSLIANIRDSDPNAASSAIMGIKDIRLMTVSETNSRDQIDEAFIKKFVSGKEKLSGRRLHQEEEQFDIHSKLVVQTNHKPELPQDAEALWNRILFLPFSRQYVINPDPNNPNQAKINLDREEQLARNLPGVFKWMAKGAVMHSQMGLSPPQCVVDATVEYRAEINDADRFVKEMCIIPQDPKLRTVSKDVYRAYCTWHEENGVADLLTDKWFGIQMSKQKCKSIKSNGVTYYPVILKRDEHASLSESLSRTSITNNLQSDLRRSVNMIPTT